MTQLLPCIWASGSFCSKPILTPVTPLTLNPVKTKRRRRRRKDADEDADTDADAEAEAEDQITEAVSQL
ncbi:hypothetical protein ElyMa_001557900 [Elysia marginata]|uniref:Uncharacterized protein n=1 Tax=Elysia marginata TaxID=1093978 RepID=A0AAV4JAX6_9GAST|nr:hypothetical protein ElyMa_001557900 [Elysia marginata]